MRISDWSSDVCSSDLRAGRSIRIGLRTSSHSCLWGARNRQKCRSSSELIAQPDQRLAGHVRVGGFGVERVDAERGDRPQPAERSEEHTSELQSLMRISYAVFCLKKKKKTQRNTIPTYAT